MASFTGRTLDQLVEDTRASTQARRPDYSRHGCRSRHDGASSGRPRLHVSVRGLRYGVLTAAIREEEGARAGSRVSASPKVTQVLKVYGHRWPRKVSLLRARYDEEPSHSDQVTMLACKFSTVWQSWHKLDHSGSRELLHSALRCCTTSAGRKRPTARAITSGPPGYPGICLEKSEGRRKCCWSRRSPAIIARPRPQPEHTDFHAMKPASTKIGHDFSGGILRIADALDRTHTA